MQVEAADILFEVGKEKEIAKISGVCEKELRGKFVEGFGSTGSDSYDYVIWIRWAVLVDI